MPRCKSLIAISAFLFISSLLFAGDLSVDGSVHGGARTSGDEGYHSFASVFTSPATGQIGNLGDVLVRWDLEVGAQLAVATRTSGEFQGYLEGQSGSPDRLQLATPGRANPAEDPQLWLNSSASVTFVADIDGDTDVVPFDWFNNGVASTNQLASLDGPGHLRITGSLYENYSFDLAETFRMVGDLEPGDIVSVSASDGRTVVKSSTAGESMIIGVVSAKPGVVMGAAPFSSQQLRDVWGDEVADLFEEERSVLESKALSVNNWLAERKEMLETAAAQVSVPEDENGGTDPAEIMRQDTLKFQGDLETKALELFFQSHFVNVALAGRVPVRVDTSFGEIQPGDYLTSSPAPGVAMKATGPGPIIGMALERSEGGDSSVLTFVHRGWYGGESTNLASRLQRQEEVLADQQAMLAAKDRKIEELSRRLVHLENAVGQLAKVAGVNSQGIALASATR